MILLRQKEYGIDLTSPSHQSTEVVEYSGDRAECTAWTMP